MRTCPSHNQAWLEKGFPIPALYTNPSRSPPPVEEPPKAKPQLTSTEGVSAVKVVESPQSTRKGNGPFSYSAGRQLAWWGLDSLQRGWGLAEGMGAGRGARQGQGQALATLSPGTGSRGVSPPVSHAQVGRQD